MDKSASASVLVVDDNSANRELVRAYLEPTYRVLEADCGAAALRVLEAADPDLVLLDVMMPGSDGFEVCREIKRRTKTGFMPVLLLTALGEQEYRNAGLESGADDFLTKPVDRRELVLRVKSFLRLREQEAVIRRQLQDLVQLDALKNDLAALIVHDIRNPLASLLGMLELAQRKVPDPALANYIQQAQQAAERVRGTVEDLLHVRLMEEGRIPLIMETIQVSDLVRDAAASLEGAARRSQQAITIQGEFDGSVEIDGKLVRRCVENLLANALKYSPPGETVEVSLVAENGTMQIDVADRGPGIPDRFKKQVFDKFGTVEASEGRQRRGFGLGLYMVRLVAELHGGDVRVRDREGGGTVFTTRLPLSRSSGAPVPDRARPSPTVAPLRSG